MSENGFSISKNSKLEIFLDFSSLQIREAKQATVVSLVFPIVQVATSAQTTEKDSFELSLLITVSSPTMNGKRKRSTVAWNTTDSCLRIDVTTPILKLVKQLHLRNGNEGKLSLEVTSIKKLQASSLETGETDKEMCQELKSKNVSKPFLVFDYTEEEVVSRGRPRTTQPNEEIRRMYNRRSTTVERNSTPADSCSAHKLVINMTSILDVHVIMPELVNIKDCSGKCYPISLPNHTLLKLRHLSNLRSNQTVQAEAAGDVCCTPSELSPIVLLIFDKNVEEYELVYIPDIIVQSCQCSS